MSASLRKQAATLTLANTATRGLGFLLRLAFARLMSAEALGLMELASGIGMLCLTPVTAGIPSAMSRLTAQADELHKPTILRSGLRSITHWALIISAGMLVLSPGLSWLLGDRQTLPALLTFVPLPLLMGLCCVYTGYATGLQKPHIPALNECIEQSVRFVLAMALLLLPWQKSSAFTAALPGMSECAAGVVVALLFRRMLPCKAHDASKAVQRQLFSLAAPMMLTRLCASGMRSLNAVLLPVCLVRSGLSQSAATAQFGLLNGMAMPLTMLPGVVTMALCSVATPAVSRLEHQPRALKKLMRQLILSAFCVGTACMALLWFSADFCAERLYHTSALSPLLRLMCPLSLLMSIRQVQFGLIAGLGQQRLALPGSLIGSALTLLITAWLCPISVVRIYGAVMGMLVGQAVEIIWCAVLLHRCMHSH